MISMTALVLAIPWVMAGSSVQWDGHGKMLRHESVSRAFGLGLMIERCRCYRRLSGWCLGLRADDRFARASLGRIQGRGGIVEGCDIADIRPQPSVPHPLDDFDELSAVGLDDEIDRQAVSGPRLDRSDDRHQCS